MIQLRKWLKSKTLFFNVVILTCVFNVSFAATPRHVEHKTTVQHKVKKIKQHVQNKKKKPRHIAAKTRRKTKPKQVANKKPLPNIKPAVNSQPIQPTTSFVASIEHRLVEFVRKTVTTLRYSAYKLGGTRFDTSRGIYVLDCSNYVDHILKAIYPRAYSKLVAASKSMKPTSDDYYHFFTKLSNRPQYYWNAVEDVKALLPGDILVFRKKNKYGDDLGGHVMIVMEKPVRDKDVFWLRIADSAPFRHSLDTRMPRVSGIGIGTFLVKVNPKTFQPAAYAWTASSRWKQNVDFAMARPVELPT